MGFNTEINLSICRTLKLLRPTPNLKILKTELISSIELLFLLLVCQGLAEKVGLFCCGRIEFCGHSALSQACVGLLPICSATWIKDPQIQPHRAHTTYK